MKLLQVSNFFGCTNLRTGGLIVGYLSLAFDIYSVTLLGNHWAFYGMSDFIYKIIRRFFPLYKKECLLPITVLQKID